VGRLTIGKKQTAIQNPAWDYIVTLPDDEIGFRPWKQYAQFHIDKTPGKPTTFHEYRRRVTSRWTWAIPSPEAIEFILRHLDGRSVVEMGAGAGYWAWLLAQSGVNVNAYDNAPVGHENSWFNGKHVKDEEWSKHFPIKPYHPVRDGGVEVLGEPENADRVLFLCWPTYDTDFAYEAVRAFQGDTIIYIGEPAGGCTGNAMFWALVDGYEPWGDEETPLPDQEWTEVDEMRMPQWSGINDVLTIYERKS
jgi:hypothetical protein